MSPRILLIGPKFHGYSESIRRGFAANGHEVVLHEYDRLPSVAKARYKVQAEVLPRLGLPGKDPAHFHTESTVDVIRQTRPDVVIVLKGDTFTADVADEIEAVGSTSILWLYDELRRTEHTASSMARYDHLISYSPLDAEHLRATGVDCLHLPNAFDPTMIPTRHGETPEVLFIGAAYPRRVELLEQLAASGVPLHLVGRDWSRHPLDRLRTMQWRRPSVEGTREVPRAEGYELTAAAAAAINIHGDQDGFTMKTFEVPGVRGVQLVDRADVVAYYEPGEEVLVFNGVDELIDLSWRCVRDRTWADRIRQAGQKRTLAEHTFAHRAREIEQLWA